MHLVKREMLASAAQGRLAQKDRRIFNSIALAAKQQVGYYYKSVLKMPICIAMLLNCGSGKL
jgi:hypothetical protein